MSTAHLVVRWLIGITCQAHTSCTTRTYPKSEGSSMTRSTIVALRGSHGASTIPLTKLFSGAPHKLLAVKDRDRVLTTATDRTQDPSVRSLRDQRLVHSEKPCLFCTGHRWHRRTVRTLRADTPPVKFLTLAQMCQPPSVSPCAHVC